VIPNIQRGQVGIRFGKPLDFSRYEGMEHDRTVLRSITDEIMYELMQLSGQEYVDVYAASVKERIAARAKSAVEGARVAVDKAVDQTRVQVEQVRRQVDERVETARTQLEQVGEQIKARSEKSAARDGDRDEAEGLDEELSAAGEVSEPAVGDAVSEPAVRDEVSEPAVRDAVTDPVPGDAVSEAAPAAGTPSEDLAGDSLREAADERR
jgi:F0F1-type ATP synthase membrane subunit b/b'